MTGTLTVEYRRPTPMGVELTVRERLRSHEGRKVTVALELASAENVCARGEMIAIENPPTL
ncbi:thioesterase [Rhodococcus jostii]|uniref:thioesterase n=1 Tax=Rhodococcus jostii TaxID=132919 RepID=UPI00364D237B